jgi:uracil-DNA glycosylase
MLGTMPRRLPGPLRSCIVFPLADSLPTPWRTALADAVHHDSFRTLEAFVNAEYAHATVFPPRELLFEALRRTPPDAVKVVLLGQDPYPTAGNANGLAFSVSPGIKVPASLKNVFKALQVELGIPPATTGDLSPWADRGVLLLNTVLTVREGEAGSHRKHGWEDFTGAVLRHVASLQGPLVFLCLGKPAEKLVTDLVDPKRHHILVAPHPSPLNGNAFVTFATTHRLFTKVNDLLVAAGKAPIDWSPPT